MKKDIKDYLHLYLGCEVIQPAFPMQPTFNSEGQVCNERYAFEGLTKREYFAAMAMQGILANQYLPEKADHVNIEKTALRCADDLLTLLSQSKT